jgi:hypothetical protein
MQHRFRRSLRCSRLSFSLFLCPPPGAFRYSLYAGWGLFPARPCSGQGTLFHHEARLLLRLPIYALFWSPFFRVLAGLRYFFLRRGALSCEESSLPFLESFWARRFLDNQLRQTFFLNLPICPRGRREISLVPCNIVFFGKFC